MTKLWDCGTMQRSPQAGSHPPLPPLCGGRCPGGAEGGAGPAQPPCQPGHTRNSTAPLDVVQRTFHNAATTGNPVHITDYRLYPAIQAQPSECAKVLSSVQPFDRAADALAEANRVWTVGIGTSYNAATVAAWMLRTAGLDARAITSMEFAFWPPLAVGDAVLLFAHTDARPTPANHSTFASSAPRRPWSSPRSTPDSISIASRRRSPHSTRPSRTHPRCTRSHTRPR